MKNRWGNFHLIRFDVFEQYLFIFQSSVIDQKKLFGIFANIMAIYEDKPTELHKTKEKCQQQKKNEVKHFGLFCGLSLGFMAHT